jgi:ribosomal protein S18 acetylase RimI-like enzyme
MHQVREPAVQRQSPNRLASSSGLHDSFVDIIDEIHGTIQLRHSPRLESCLHRALLAMGIERSHRAQGWGRQLLEAALGWAQAQPSLDWIDLGVFENNAPARALYSRFGFREVGRREDLFRAFGVKITDIEMVLKLR